ncbi:TetR/AcrR family transcriptional regulator [Luethyella okanaganae]|uniref:TetR/AcrR family transcriptional regulator n=1 Tax=Luethyella okanaganae TaxID=69372 RepID=A0ABW1VK47_9MICO
MVEKKDSTIQPTTHAKVRILATADALFYHEGVHTVGVDRIISEASVTKATFYKYFRSKDTLIVAYLRGRDKRIRLVLHDIETRFDTPERRLKELAREIAEEVIRPDFRGCPFINATAQFGDPTHPVREAITVHREWYIEQVENLFRGAGHPHPGDAVDEFFLARDGAFASANLGDPVAAHAALLRAMNRIFADLD